MNEMETVAKKTAEIEGKLHKHIIICNENVEDMINQKECFVKRICTDGIGIKSTN